MATSISFFDVCYVRIWFLQPSISAMKDCKHVLLRLWRIVSMRSLRCCQVNVLSTVARSRCKQCLIFRSSKNCVPMVFAYVPFPYYLFQCTSQTSVDDEQSKEDDHKALKCNFILSASFLCCCHSYETLFFCLSQKKIWYQSSDRVTKEEKSLTPGLCHQATTNSGRLLTKAVLSQHFI
jgi:hypothetical protein